MKEKKKQLAEIPPRRHTITTGSELAARRYPVQPVIFIISLLGSGVYTLTIGLNCVWC